MLDALVSEGMMEALLAVVEEHASSSSSPSSSSSSTDAGAAGSGLSLLLLADLAAGSERAKVRDKRERAPTKQHRSTRDARACVP